MDYNKHVYLDGYRLPAQLFGLGTTVKYIPQWAIYTLTYGVEEDESLTTEDEQQLSLFCENFNFVQLLDDEPGFMLPSRPFKLFCECYACLVTVKR